MTCCEIELKGGTLIATYACSKFVLIRDFRKLLQDEGKIGNLHLPGERVPVCDTKSSMEFSRLIFVPSAGWENAWEFWTKLSAATLKRRHGYGLSLDMLELKQIFCAETQILVRSRYVYFAQLAKQVLKLTRIANVGLVQHMFVCGTPGTGKTLFGIYLLWDLSTSENFRKRAFIWEEAYGTSFFFKGEDVRIGRAGDFDHLADDSTIYLVNGPGLRPEQAIGTVFMFAADKRKSVHYRHFLKETLIHTVYMPLWEEDELCLAFHGRRGGKAAVKEAYRRWGGVARAVLGQAENKEYKKESEKAIAAACAEKMKIGDGLEYEVERYMAQAEEVMEFVFHIKVLNSQCTEVEVVYASEFVKDELTDNRS